MPTYHYRCKSCDYDFTKQQSFTDDPITVCPECGKEQVRKVYSTTPTSPSDPAGAEPEATRRSLWITRILRPQPRIRLAPFANIRSSSAHDDLFSYLDGTAATKHRRRGTGTKSLHTGNGAEQEPPNRTESRCDAQQQTT